MTKFAPRDRRSALRAVVRHALTAALVAALMTPAGAFARSAGVAALGCDTCHGGGKVPTVTLMADPPSPSVGQAVTLTIGVSQTNGNTAGFYLTTAFDVPGTFKAIESGTTSSGSGVMHTMPRTGTGGVTTFKAQWTASTATGVEFDVYAISANGDRTNRGDGPGLAKLSMAAGCTPSTYYIDQDADGYGSTDPAYQTRQDCAPPLGYAAKTGDCDDFHAVVHPGAAEQCDMKDNDCNGQVDDNVVIQAFCQDQDGDGHGSSIGTMKMDCKPTAGFAPCDGDCDDRDANVHPGASEVCNNRDDNCDGKVDEGVRKICGLGLCARYAVGCGNDCTPGAPFVESCNGYDDDCDGVVDNGNNQSLCGDPGLSCNAGHCTGEPTGAVGGSAGTGTSGPTAGGSSVGGSSVVPSAGGTSGLGLSAAPEPEGSCALVRSSGPGHAAWLALAGAALAQLVRRRRARVVTRVAQR